jgi:type I restriction enzyme M protein
VERPLRLRVSLSNEACANFRKVCEGVNEEPLANLIDRAYEVMGAGVQDDYNLFGAELAKLADKSGVKLTAKRQKLVQNELAQRHEAAMPVVKKRYRAGKVEADALYGRYEITGGGKPCVVEYEPDAELRDTEQIPLLEVGGIEAFVRREVLPHVADAWVDAQSIKVGYEVSFTRYFYKPQPLRSLADIRADIVALENENKGLLAEIIGEGAA